MLALVTFNVVMGTNQEMKARASVEALAKLQVPHARVRRSGEVEEVDSTTLVPGDIVLLEAGDVVPADGRIVSSATLEVQEAALTGESAPVAKNRETLPDGEVALGDRTNMVFQNTQVTRGTATFVVTATGQDTQMGQIAGMVTATKRTRSPLQRELDGMTKVFGSIAWLAVAVIAIVGIVRGQDIDTLVLLCISTAIASIPVGLPTFVQTMLSSGAQRLAAAKAVVKSLTDVETLGGTTVINSDKTGTLTMNAMTATTMLAGGEWFRIEGGGYEKTGAILGVAGGEPPDFRRLALGLVLCSDATVGDDESVIGDPTEAAFVVLAAKMGVDAEETRAALPRRAEVPFDSEYKFMATFHDRPGLADRRDLAAAALHDREGRARRGARTLRHGALARRAGPDRRPCATRSSRPTSQLSERGLRVLAFAARDLDDAAMTPALTDPMAAVTDLVFVALVGIIDPLRAEAKDAVRVALDAGIDVRMITGDHTVTARAIADELGLGPGVITGTELQHLTDAEVIERLPAAARVRPGRAGGQAAAGPAHAGVRRGRRDDRRRRQRRRRAQAGRHRRRHGQRLRGLQAGRQDRADRRQLRDARARGRPRPRHLPAHHVVRQAAAHHPVVGAAADAATRRSSTSTAASRCSRCSCCSASSSWSSPSSSASSPTCPTPSVMQRPPRKPGTRIVNRPQIVRWFVSGFLVAAIALAVLEWGPDKPSTTHASISMTMAFAIVALSAVNLGLVMRREREPAWSSPVFPYLGWIILGWVLTWAAVELGMLQRLLDTVSLTGGQWLVGARACRCVMPPAVGVDKAIQLRRQRTAPPDRPRGDGRPVAEPGRTDRRWPTRGRNGSRS